MAWILADVHETWAARPWLAPRVSWDKEGHFVATTYHLQAHFGHQ